MIVLKYWNESLQIGLANWRQVYQFPQKECMLTEIHQGRLYYRSKGSARRVSYRQLKKGLVKKKIIIKQELYLLPF